MGGHIQWRRRWQDRGDGREPAQPQGSAEGARGQGPEACAR